jgi:hypothetical protein
MGIFECRQCKDVRKVARRYTYHLGKDARCPLCGTYRLRVLAEKDHIDRMYTNLVNLAKRVFGGRLLHCRYCRVQFYDRRPLSEEATVKRSLAG